MAQPQIVKAKLQPMDCLKMGYEVIRTDYWLFLALIFVGLFVGGLVPIIILGAMWCGISKCFLTKSANRPVTFSTLFEGFDHFVDGLLAVLGVLVVSFIASLPYIAMWIAGALMLASGSNVLIVLGGLTMFGAIIYILVVSSVMNFAMMFSSCLIVQYKMPGFEAFKMAMSGIKANLIGLSLVGFVSTLAIFLGTMLCIIPGILVMPITIACQYVCYRKIFRSNKKPAPPVKQG